jgi:hypothetical protein
LVEIDGRWSTAPGGFRIVWKAASAAAQAAATDVEPGDCGPITGDFVAEPEAASTDRRAYVERRADTSGELPKFLNGRDRRGIPRRLPEFGSKKPMAPARDGRASEVQLNLAI